MINYKIGNLFDNIPSGNVIICHIVNDLNCWGSGFVIPLGIKFPKSKKEYLSNQPLLGKTQFVDVQDGIVVANMCGQTGIGIKSIGNYERVQKPIRYAALCDCLEHVTNFCNESHIPYQVIAPAFGSVRSGGHWPFIEELIKEILTAPVDITIFSLNKLEHQTLWN